MSAAATAVRGGLGALGVAGTAYGLWLLAGQGAGQWFPVLVWAVGGVVVHDGVLAPLVVVLGVAVAVRAPAWWRTPVLLAAVVLGPLTLLAVPVLGRFGARPDNPTLLDRPYWLGYLLVVGVVVVLTTVSALRRRARASRSA